MVDIDKKKYLVPEDLTVGSFVYTIRKRIKLPSEKSLFLYADNLQLPTGALVATIYKQHVDEDGFLYITYTGLDSFGAE